MSKIRTSTTLAAGFIGGVAFLVACGGGSTNNSIAQAVTEYWEKAGSSVFYTSGNVGIGTNTPSANLHIEGTNAHMLIKSENTAQGGNAVYRADAKTVTDAAHYQVWVDGVVKWGLGNDRTADESFGVFEYDSSFNQTNHLIIQKTSGNVGIGTDTPGSKLAVSGLPTSAPDASGNAGVVCVTNNGNFWLDNDGTADCI